MLTDTLNFSSLVAFPHGNKVPPETDLALLEEGGTTRMRSRAVVVYVEPRISLVSGISNSNAMNLGSHFYPR